MENIDLSKFDWNLIKNSIYEQWKDLQEADFEIKRLSGLSNYVYSISVPKLAEITKPIVYKIYTNYFITMQDREREKKVAKMLESQKYGPKVYYADNKIRIEEFWPFDHVQVEEMTQPQKMNQIAHLFAFFHQNKILKEEEISAKFVNHLQRKQVLEAVQNSIQISDLQLQEQKEELLKMVDFIFSTKMIDYILQSMDNAKTPLVFCHNDTNSTNLLFDNANKRIYFLDYEYAGYNYRAFEFGNFFNEQLWDYEVKQPPFFAIKKELYPSDQQRYSFFANYIVATILHKRQSEERFNPSKYSDLNLQDLYQTILQFQDEKFQSNEDIINEIKQYDSEANAGKLLSHICWFLVAALTFSYKDLHFDCYSYCKLRFNEIKQIVGDFSN
ncbi:hypothetical protein ABPG72_006936 [Tetrahymena utriculariae]